MSQSLEAKVESEDILAMDRENWWRFFVNSSPATGSSIKIRLPTKGGNGPDNSKHRYNRQSGLRCGKPFILNSD